MTIGKMLKDARMKVGISQKELAERLNTTSQNLAQYENDRRKPKIDTLRKICSAMDISINELGEDIWKCYSVEDFAEDWADRTRSTASKIPEQIETSVKCSIKKTSENLQQASKQAQQHAYEIIDSDWRCVPLLHDYEKLNTVGRSEAQRRINELTEIKRYTEPENE